MTVTQFSLLLASRAARRAALVCALAVCPGIDLAFADDAPDRDLQGVLPDYIPDRLTEGDFNQLKDNWAAWGTETGRLVTDFYTSDDDEVRGRRATLEKLRVKLNTMEKALEDPQYLPIYGTLADLHARLARRIGLAEGLLKTIEQDVSVTRQDRFASSLHDLGGRAGALRNHMSDIVDGEKWVSFLRLNEIDAVADTGDASNETVVLLTNVKTKLDDRTRYGEPQREFLSREPVLQFEDSLTQTVALLQAEDTEGVQSRLRDLSAQLLEAVEEYELDPTTEHMEAIRNTYDDIRRVAPDGGAALTEAMRTNYLNYNLRMVIDESLMQDVIRDTRMESGFIDDMILGAKVTGCQWTNATVNLDLKPCETAIRFDLIVNGDIRSSAQGETHTATVFTSGRHRFTARKSICFDGEHFNHWRATIQVGGTSCPYAAQTCLSWAPLLGGLSEDFAIKVANDKKSESDAYAINKIRREASSQFDRETGKMLSEAELSLEDKVFGPLRQGGYYPDIKQLNSTETDVQIRTRLMEAGELGGGDTLPLPIYPTHGALVQLHESLLNQIGNRLELDGKRYTPKALKEYLQAEMESITGQPVDLGNLFPDPSAEGPTVADENANPEAAPEIEEVIFHDTDAIRFQIRGGEIVLLLNMGLKLEGRDEIPPQRLSIPLTPTVNGNQVHIEPGTIGVSPIGPVAPGDRAQQIAKAGIMRAKMEDAFEPQDIDSIYTFDVEQKQVTLKVTDLRARGGWLSIIATDGIGKTGTPTGQPMQQARGQQTTITK